MSDINLQPFCSVDEIRAYLLRPFSRGDHTFATDGCIAIRVARRADVPDNPDAPDVVKLFEKRDASHLLSWRALRRVEFPSTPPSMQCRGCKGRGHEHDCPHCHCHCYECGGTGHVEADVSMCIGDTLFSVKYVRLLASLPAIEVPDQIPVSPDPMPFRFDGGDGLLIGLRHQYRDHADLSA